MFTASEPQSTTGKFTQPKPTISSLFWQLRRRELSRDKCVAFSDGNTSASGPMSKEIHEERKMRHHINRIVLVCAIVLSSHPALAQLSQPGPKFTQQGPKLVATGSVGNAEQGRSVSLSADGNTAIVGGETDNSGAGAAWVWTRSGQAWAQGAKLVGSGAVASNPWGQGHSVSLSGDGNTAIVGGCNDTGTWVWTKVGSVWAQQGPKLVPSGVSGFGFAGQGCSVSLSADGNTAIIGGPADDNTNFTGAAWVWTRSAGVWTQQGPKLVGSGAVGPFTRQGSSVSLSADGNTAIVGGYGDNNNVGAAWVWMKTGGVWTQQGPKLVGSGAVGNAQQGHSVSLSADGNTAIVGGSADGVSGAAWVWTRSAGVWTQQGSELFGSGGPVAMVVQGYSVSLSADGNTAIVGGFTNGSLTAAAWAWTRSGGVWTQQDTMLVGSGAVGVPSPDVSMSLSADGNTAIVGGGSDNGSTGAAWVFAAGTPQEPNWVQKSSANAPTPRYQHAMAYDADRGQVVLFGGWAGSPSNDTWVWDGTNWTQKSPANSPPQRFYDAMSYDATHGQVVLFGGTDGSSTFNDTWVWDGTNWTCKIPANSPSALDYHAMAYDAARGEVVLFGGWVGSFSNDTWAWNGTNWTQKSPANSPTRRFLHAMAYDTARGQVVLFGGSDGLLRNDTWVWSGDSPPPTGSISVTTNLAAASFTIAGPATYAGVGTSFTQSNAPAGTYTITYGAVNCFAAPVSETRTLTAGGTLNFSTANYQGRATITVSVAPIGATSATFSINPPVPTMPSNGPYPRVQSNVWPQVYKVAFGGLTGFTSPPAQTLSPSAACSLDFTGNYTPAVPSGTVKLSVSTNRPPPFINPGTFTINGGVEMTSFPQTGVPTGKYVIQYKPIAGYYTPKAQTVVLNPGDSPVDLQGKYRRLFLVSFTGWNNAPSGSYGFPLICTSLLPGAGIQYYSTDNQAGAGMIQLLREVPPLISQGAKMAAFTFYSTDAQGHQNGDACSAPSDRSDHREAWDWVTNQSPTRTQDDIVVVVGHSYGGHRAKLFVEQLKRGGINTDLLVTVDPIDWGLCQITNLVRNLYTDACIQLTDTVQINQSPAKATISYYQSIGIGSGLLRYPLEGYVIPNAIIKTDARVSHTDIDDLASIHTTILDSLSALTAGPKTPTVSMAGTSSRDNSGLSYPIRVTVPGFFGIASGVTVTAATLNGIPALNLSSPASLGDIQAGTSSSTVNLVFPGTAASKGAVVYLTVRGAYSYGTPFLNTSRQVVP